MLAFSPDYSLRYSLLDPSWPPRPCAETLLISQVTLSCDECSTPSLDRQQFLQVLFHASATCFADSHLLSAVRRLFAHIHAHAPPQVLHLPNCFRESACYTEGVDRVLRAHEQVGCIEFNYSPSPDLIPQRHVRSDA